MANKRCMVYETLGEVKNLQVSESAAPHGMVRLEGVFGVCGVKNQNNRVYDKANYSQMVESLQKVIRESGCPGELEHPNSMNINLENVSHKIEDIKMNEDGTITGTILLLNTPKGQIAQAIVEGGLPLYISSRGTGTITNEGKVTLSTIKTYDLVGTPGFSQAKLTLKKNQTLECLNESLDEGNIMYAIVEGEDASSDDPEKKDPEKKEENKDDNKNKDNKKVDMGDLKEAIEKLTEKVTSLEAELHVAKESFDDKTKSIEPTNYEAIQRWITEEFLPKCKEEASALAMEQTKAYVETKIGDALADISEGVEEWIDTEYSTELKKTIDESVDKYVVKEFAPLIEEWVTTEYSNQINEWVTTEYSNQINEWVTTEYSNQINEWVTTEYSSKLDEYFEEEFKSEIGKMINEEFASDLQEWIAEEFAPVVEGWIAEEFAENHKNTVMEAVNANVSAFMESQKAGRLEEIDSLLESISQDDNADVKKIVEEQAKDNKYKGIYVVEGMPAEYRPSWELLTEARQQEIIRSSKMYDFTKAGVMESFWANVDFNKVEEKQQINESIANPVNNYQASIISRMKTLRGLNG